MTIYLGDAGSVELKRDSSGNATLATIAPSDVNVDRRRFGIDEVAGSLVTGDRVEIATADGSNLELVAGHQYPDGQWFVHINEAGGIRLYDRFDKAVSGNAADALPLVQPAKTQSVLITTRNTAYRCVARIKSFEVSTTRETVDTTLIGDEFRRQYEAGLISGQGTLNCLWEHTRGICEGETGGDQEFPFYLASLVIRMQQGADFSGRFVLFNSGSTVVNSVWYEADCIVTNVVVTVSVDKIVETAIQFVTTGPVQLRTGRPPSYLLLEDGEFLLQEDGSRFLLEDGT